MSMASIKVNVCVYAFDCLYLNGRALLQEPLTARRAALHEALVESKGHLELATAKVRAGGWGWRWMGAGGVGVVGGEVEMFSRNWSWQRWQYDTPVAVPPCRTADVPRHRGAHPLPG